MADRRGDRGHRAPRLSRGQLAGGVVRFFASDQHRAVVPCRGPSRIGAGCRAHRRAAAGPAVRQVVRRSGAGPQRRTFLRRDAGRLRHRTIWPLRRPVRLPARWHRRRALHRGCAAGDRRDGRCRSRHGRPGRPDGVPRGDESMEPASAAADRRPDPARGDGRRLANHGQPPHRRRRHGRDRPEPVDSARRGVRSAASHRHGTVARAAAHDGPRLLVRGAPRPAAGIGRRHRPQRADQCCGHRRVRLLRPAALARLRAVRRRRAVPDVAGGHHARPGGDDPRPPAGPFAD